MGPLLEVVHREKSNDDLTFRVILYELIESVKLLLGQPIF